MRFQPGALKAVAHFADGLTAEQVLTTAGPAAAIRLTPHMGPRGIVAEGADLMLVDVEVVDAHGQRVPTAFNAVDFRLDGSARWCGGIAQGDSSRKSRSTAATMRTGSAGATPTTGTGRGENNYILSRHLPVELGVNRVLVRSTNLAGHVRLTATAPRLTLAALDVTTAALPAVSGLSTDFPEDAQPSDLSRGLTPAGSSVVERARTVAVAGIIAGSNRAQAANSHDDNEASTWTSDGKQRMPGSSTASPGPSRCRRCRCGSPVGGSAPIPFA